MKQWLGIVSFIVVVFVFPSLIVRHFLYPAVCMPLPMHSHILEWFCGPSGKNIKIYMLIVLGIYTIVMIVSMLVFRLTHKMPFAAWCSNDQFFLWMRRIFYRKKLLKYFHQNWPEIVWNACINVEIESSKRQQASLRYSDEDFFNVIMSLPDEKNVFRIVAEKIGPVMDWEKGDNLGPYVSREQVDILMELTDPLSKMGLVFWGVPDNQGAWMRFDKVIVERLAINHEGCARLKLRLDATSFNFDA